MNFFDEMEKKNFCSQNSSLQDSNNNNCDQNYSFCKKMKLLTSRK